MTNAPLPALLTDHGGKAPLPQRNGALIAHVAFLLALQCKRNEKPGRVIVSAGVAPEQWGDRRLRVFDLALSFAEPSSVAETAEPIVLIDLVEPGSEEAARDKAWVCTSIPSVTDIILINTTKMAAECLHRGADGAWPEQSRIIGRGMRLEIGSIGFDRRLSELYETTDL